MRFAVIIGVLLVALPLLARVATDDPFPDVRSYEGVRSSTMGSYDSLYSMRHYPTISDWLFSHVKPQIVLIVLAAITLFAVSMLYGRESFLLLLATTPAFIATFTTVSEGALGITIMALGALLMQRRQYWAILAIPICFSLSFALGILAGVTFIVVSLMQRMPFIALGASFFSLLSGIATVVLAPQRGLGLTVPSLQQLIGVFGAADGVTIFVVFLAAIGFLLTWRMTQQHQHLFALLIIPCVLFFEHGTVLFAVILAYYAANAWSALVERRWHFDELRSITLLLIVCGVLFTTITVEKQRFSIDESRMQVVRFTQAAYPPGTTIYAGSDIAPLFAYYGYPAHQRVALPRNPAFIASTLRNEGYKFIVTKEKAPPFAHFPVVYADESGYTLYAVPTETGL